MSDPKPEVMFVDGGVVSAFACGPGCTCNRHGIEPRPDWEAEARQWREAWEDEYNSRVEDDAECETVLEANGVKDHYPWHSTAERIEWLASTACAWAFEMGRQIAGNGPSFNDQPSDHGEVATPSLDASLTPWGGFARCHGCDGVLTTDEFALGSHCESCQQVVE